MLKTISPQVVSDDDLGFTVKVIDRHQVKYLEAERYAVIEVDFGPIIGIYRDTVTLWDSSDSSYPMSDCERDKVISRVVKALQFMGSKVEIC